MSRTAQAIGFAVVRTRSRPRPARIELLDRRGGAAHLTTVARVPAEEAASLVATAASLPTSRRQYLYPPGDLHLTIANLDAAHRPLADVLDGCRAIARATPPFHVRVHGLGMTAQSVYAQVWDDSGALRRLRDHVAAAADSDLSQPRRLLGFVNLVRFRDRDVEEMADAVHAHRRADLGSFQVASFEVARTDKLLAADRTTVLARLPLIGRARHEKPENA